MKVMIVTNSFTGGGAERSANITANELSALGVDVSLVAINSGPLDLVRIAPKNYCLGRSWQGGLFQTLLAILHFNFLVLKIRPSFIIANCELPELLAAFTLYRSKIIVVEHTSVPWIGRFKLGLLIRRILDLRRSVFVAVSSHLRIWPWFKAPVRVIQNPIDFNKFQLNINTKEISSIKRLVFIGRLNGTKNPKLVIEVSKNVGLPCIFIGEGDLRVELDSLSRDIQVESEFVGRVDNPWKLLRPGDVLVVPSNLEGDGLVILEALLHEIPIIIREIPDLLRFDFPRKNYAATVEDFSSRINEFRNSANDLKIDSDMSDRLTSLRNPKRIADSWVTLLEEVNCSKAI